MRVLLHTGKGGVGKTSLSLATALGAAEHGHRVLVLSTDSAHSLGDALGQRVGPRPVEVAEGVAAQEISALAELERSWSPIRDWLRALLRSDADPLVAEELLAFPGLEELIALRGVLEAEASEAYDVCVVDCAPTGSTLRMLRFPDALRFLMRDVFHWERRAAQLMRPLANRVGAGDLVASDAVFAAVERLYEEVADVRQILLDTDRTSARLVVNPARVVVDETRRAFAYLSLYGIATDAVLVNRVLPEEAAAGGFARWSEREAEQMQEIARSFPMERLCAPLLPREPIGVEALRALGRALYGASDPARLYAHSRPIRLRRRSGLARLEIELPGARREEVDVAARGDELVVRVRDAQRRIALPASLSGRALGGVSLAGGVLEVSFLP